MRETLWYISNLGIAAGYYVLALALYRLLAQFMKVNLAVKVGAVGFFATCALTHIEHALHLYGSKDSSVGTAVLAPHSLIIHAVQVLAVWLFIIGILMSLQDQQRVNAATARTLRQHLDASAPSDLAERRTPPGRRQSP